mmetsp:Transcript_15923/g.24592  ORF Transcript_15923/g.24592 Transcript_15923/m.24592 type:complete len:144 (+) Transcript_15923:962-1393(+)
MESAVSIQKKKILGEEAADRIASQVRAFLCRRRFKRALYKMIVLQNVLQQAHHKQEMLLYRSFMKWVCGPADSSMEKSSFDEGALIKQVKSIDSGDKIEEYISLEKSDGDEVNNQSTMQESMDATRSTEGSVNEQRFKSDMSA